MQYITGIWALNLTCSLDTCGDWHQSCLDWTKPTLHDSDSSIYGEYGIERNIQIPLNHKRFNVANHLRAVLDMLVENPNTSLYRFRDEFVSTNKYDQEFMGKIWEARILPNWKDIEEIVVHDYLMDWVNFKREHDSHYKDHYVTISHRKVVMDESVFSDLFLNTPEIYDAAKREYIWKMSLESLYYLTQCFFTAKKYNEDRLVHGISDVFFYNGFQYFSCILQTKINPQIDSFQLAKNVIQIMSELGLRDWTSKDEENLFEGIRQTMRFLK